MFLELDSDGVLSWHKHKDKKKSGEIHLKVFECLLIVVKLHLFIRKLFFQSNSLKAINSKAKEFHHRAPMSTSL